MKKGDEWIRFGGYLFNPRTQKVIDVARQINKKIGSVFEGRSATDTVFDDNAELVVETDQLPNRIFVPARDEKGNIIMIDGVPVVADPDFVVVQRAWNFAQTQEKKTRDEPRRFPHRLVPLSVAIERIGTAGSNRNDLDAVRTMLRKSQSWGDRLSDSAKSLLLALSITRSKKSPLEQKLAEDFFKDLPDNGDIALLEALAKNLEAKPRRPDGSLSDDDFDAAVAFMDDWLGAELTWWSRVQRFCSRLWQNRARMNADTTRKIKFAFWVLVGISVAIVALFVFSIAAMIYGTLVDLTQPLLGKDPRRMAASLVFVGAWTTTIILFLLRPLQGILNPVVHKILGASENWLTNTGLKFTLLIAPLGFIMPLALLCGASIYARLLIIGLPLLAIGSIAAFKAAEVPAMARMLTIRAAKYGWIVGLLVIGIDWLIRSDVILKVWTAVVLAWKFVVANQYLSSVLLFAFVLMLGNLLIVRTIERTKYRSGNTLVIDKKTSWFARFAVVVIAIVIALLPWIDTRNMQKFDPFAPNQAATNVNPDTTAPPKTIAPDAGVPAQAGRNRGASHIRKLDCSELSFEGRRAVGCP